MKTRYLVLSLILSFSFLYSIGQNNLKDLINNTYNIGDTITIKLDNQGGTIQWQESIDLTVWTNITGQTLDSLIYIVDSEKYIRASVIHGSCNPYYSDTLSIEIQLYTPTLTTATVSNITSSSALCGGNITDDGGDSILVRGVCWNTSGSPTFNDSHTIDGSGSGLFISNISGLLANTTYYVRAYATNSVGIAYGNQRQFLTLNPFVCGDSLVDYDGNTYNTVLIGTQCWMSENLATTHYSSGTLIPNVTSNSTWGALLDNNTDDAYCYYGNSSTNANIYGALYTWAAAMGDNAVSSSTNPSGVQGACPTGWHLPSDNEWKQLEMQLGMSQSQADATGYRGTDQGSQLAGNSTLWNSGSLENNTNFGTSGFTALPGGYRHYGSYGSFSYLGYYGYWWSSTEGDSSSAWYRGLGYSNSEVTRSNYSKSYGFSVRCLKD